MPVVMDLLRVLTVHLAHMLPLPVPLIVIPVAKMSINQNPMLQRVSESKKGIIVREPRQKSFVRLARQEMVAMQHVKSVHLDHFKIYRAIQHAESAQRVGVIMTQVRPIVIQHPLDRIR